MLAKGNTRNTLARKFSEIRDFPKTHKLGTYGRGSILADEDIVNRRQQYSCSVRCDSEKGILYQMECIDFRLLKQSPDAWSLIEKQAELKEEKRKCLNIKTSPR